MSVEDDEEVQVEVLYDYAYTDDSGTVEIQEGDIYKLVEKTNDEWWHVCSITNNNSCKDTDGFFVPAQYVKIVKKHCEQDSVISTLDNILDEEENRMSEITIGKLDHKEGCAKLKAPNGRGASPKLNQETSANGVPEIRKKEANEDSGEYVNLAQYRLDASIPSVDISSTNGEESDYANVPYQHAQLPRLEDGVFVKVLVDDMPWDVYQDHGGRRFYHNRETGELAWKPPRKEKPNSLSQKLLTPIGAQDKSPGESLGTSSPSSSFGLDGGSDTDSPNEYEQVDENGDVFYVHRPTQERWKRLVDQVGRPYFHRLGSSDTSWELPAAIRSKSETTNIRSADRKAAGAGSGLVLMRQSKSKSMYGKIDVSNEVDISKAGTLPPNFAPVSADQLSGYLNKAKIAELGKKKTKKSWNQTYVVLQSANLVFYKDHKAAAHKPGSPFGRPEGVVCLNRAKISFNPRELTSKRNTIMVSVNSGSQFLLQSDDEKLIHEFLFRMKLAANDISQDLSSKDGEGAVSKPGLVRSQSSEEGGVGVSVDKARSIVGIRSKLLNFISRRPTQEDLVKRGIIKDAVFGSSLQSLCDRDKCPVPTFVLECITAVENKGLDHDGLYRISGNLAEIQRLRYVIDKDDSHNLMDAQWDIHTLTGALKLFFRELREPLFPFKSVNKFIDATRKETSREKLKAFKEALASLPRCNYETMRVLFQHLKNVVEFSRENRMQVQNVAIVFGPTLMWAEGDLSNMAILTMCQSRVVEFILLEYDTLFA